MSINEMFIAGTIGVIGAIILAMAVDLMSMYVSAEVRVAVLQAFARRDALERHYQAEIVGVE